MMLMYYLNLQYQLYLAIVNKFLKKMFNFLMSTDTQRQKEQSQGIIHQPTNTNVNNSKRLMNTHNIAIQRNKSYLQQPQFYEKSVLNETNTEDANNLRMMKLMREQIQICCKIYTEKMDKQLKTQAKSIVILKQKLIQNQKQLKQKQIIIKSLQSNNSHSPLKRKLSIFSINNSRKDSSKVLEVSQKLQKTMTLPQIQDKMQKIQAKLNQMHEQQAKRLSLVRQNNKKLEYVEKAVIQYYGMRLYKCYDLNKQHFQVHNNQIQKMFQKLQQIQSNITSPQLQRTNSLTDNNNKQFKYSVSSLNNQLLQIKQALQAMNAKQFKYESYQLDQLQRIISNLKKSITILEGQNKLIKTTVKELQQKVTTTSINCIMSERLTYQHDKSIKNNTEKLVKDNKFECNNDKTQVTRNNSSSKIQSKQYNNEYEDIDSENYTEEDQDQYFCSQDHNISTNQQRLINVLKSLHLNFPVAVQIDQTGYLKSIDTGYYLLDNDGDGFELDQKQIYIFVRKGIILITQ